METRNPRRGEPARAEQSIAADRFTLRPHRPILKASAAARMRLALLLWPYRPRGVV